MKKSILLLFSISILLSGCSKENFPDNIKGNEAEELKDLEKIVRESQDSRAKFTWAEYEELLSVLDNDKFIVLSLDQFRDSINTDKVLIGMRHDVDRHPFKAMEMAQMEKDHGFQATYFVLATAPYYGMFTGNVFDRFLCMELVYRKLQDLGHEIGIHNDLLSIMIEHDKDPFIFNRDELQYFESIGINIHGTAAHGSSISNETVDNFQIFSDFATVKSITYKGGNYEIGKYSLKEFGYDYEAYFIDYNKYYSESGGNWSIEGGHQKMMEIIRNSIPGDKIQILTHPLWWGK